MASRTVTRLVGYALVALLVVGVNWSSSPSGGHLFLVVWALAAVLLAPVDRRVVLASTMALGVTIGLAVSFAVGGSGWGGTTLAMTAPLVLGWLGQVWQSRTVATHRLPAESAPLGVRR